MLSLSKLPAFFPAASILTTSEIKVISTPNSAEKKDSLTGDDEHGWVRFNKYFFTPWASEFHCRWAYISYKKLRWVRAKCLFFQNGVLFCGNRGSPSILTLFATEQQKAVLCKGYLIKLAYEEKLFALRTRHIPCICLRMIRAIYAHDGPFMPPGAVTASITWRIVHNLFVWINLEIVWLILLEATEVSTTPSARQTLTVQIAEFRFYDIFSLNNNCARQESSLFFVYL